MSHLADEEAKQCPPNVYSETQIYPRYPPPYRDYAPPYHGGTDYSNKYNPACTSFNKLPFPTTELKQGNTFGRVVLCLMVGLIFGASLLSLLLWVLFGSDVPNFQIQTFSIPSFNLTGSTLKANWAAGLTLINPNHKLDICFEQTESSLVYKNYIIDTSLVDSFQVEKNQEMTMDIGFSVPAFNDEYYNTTGAPWVKDMQEERRKGSLVFEMRIITSATFLAGDFFWRRQTDLKVVCVELKVDFPATTGGGTWNGDKKECMLYH
ncbi:hydroxyproline-rich glycoprotein family protein [Abeliophyllum distichum]|uniref:Hydroxyproline-rich glycoprotein family protein n=1 Tax=Abeliophyllum distichum TaxID=126358 RepID=A0ABD1QZU3_9LAMI